MSKARSISNLEMPPSVMSENDVYLYAPEEWQTTTDAIDFAAFLLFFVSYLIFNVTYISYHM